MKITYHIFFTILLALTSCKQENRFLLVRDNDYFEPAYRFSEMSNNDSLFTLHERYFVFNYAANKDRFRDTVLHLICNRLNDSLSVSYYNVDFQEIWWSYSGTYEEGTPLPAEITKPIFSCIWDILIPDSVVFKYDKESHYDKEMNSFDCAISH